MERDISTVCSHPVIFVICSHVPHCSPKQILSLLHNFVLVSLFSNSLLSSSSSLLGCSSTFSSVSSLTSIIYSLILHVSFSVTPHSLPRFLAFSVPPSAFTHGLSVSCLSLRIWLFTPLLSPYLSMPSINTHLSRPHLNISAPSSFITLVPSFFSSFPTEGQVLPSFRFSKKNLRK